MGSRSVEKQLLVQKFANSQVKYFGAKFGANISNPKQPITHLTIDQDGVLHGWYVIVSGRGNTRQTPRLSQFAKEMTGIMKVHVYEIRSMQDPVIIDLN